MSFLNIIYKYYLLAQFPSWYNDNDYISLNSIFISCLSSIRKFNTSLFLFCAGWTLRQSYVSWEKETLSSWTRSLPLMILLMPQRYIRTEPLYGKPYFIKTHLHHLRSRKALLTHLANLLRIEDLSRTKETPEVAAVPTLGVTITNTASWCVLGVSWVRARYKNSATAFTSWSARPDAKTRLL